MVEVINGKLNVDKDTKRIEDRVLASVVKCIKFINLLKQRVFSLRLLKGLVTLR
jgi:hypothetical protein